MDDLASAASARSIEMLAISWVCCCICSRLSITRRMFANVNWRFLIFRLLLGIGSTNFRG